MSILVDTAGPSGYKISEVKRQRVDEPNCHGWVPMGAPSACFYAKGKGEMSRATVSQQSSQYASWCSECIRYSNMYSRGS